MPSHPSAARSLGLTLAGAMLILLPGACGPRYLAPPVTAQLESLSPATPSRLQRGYLIHQVTCAKCHPFENPANYRPEDLTRQIIPAMARKAKLEPSQAEAVLAYLLAARQVPPAGQRPVKP